METLKAIIASNRSVRKKKIITTLVVSAIAVYSGFEVYSLSGTVSLMIFGGEFNYIVDPFFSPRTEFWHQFYYIIPRLLFVLLSAWIVFIVYRSLTSKKGSFRSNILTLGYPETVTVENTRSSDKNYSLLSIAVAIAIIVGTLPYLSTINSAGHPVGVDHRLYAKAISEMSSHSPLAALSFAVDQDRPLSIIILYAISGVTSTDADVMKTVPTILTVANVVSIYFLVLEITGNRKIAGTASIIEAVSIHTIVGIGGAFYANWMAFVFINIGLLFVIRGMRSSSFKTLIVGSAVLSVTTFIHSWTWFFVMAVFGIFTMLNAMTSKLEKSSFRYAKYSAIVIGLNFVIDLVQYAIITGSSTITDYDVLAHRSGVEAGLGILSYFSVLNAFTLLTALNYSFLLFMGGALSSILLLSLGFLGIGSRERFSLVSYRLLVVWIAISTFGILFSPIGPAELLFEWTQARFIFFLPLSILAGVGLVAFQEWLTGKLDLRNRLMKTLFQIGLYTAVMTSLFNIYTENMLLYVSMS